ncbi:hypothetical protein [Kitasatospora sp. NPDC059327]|uniref:hypothetical protein n=1 Tax=Kitasatospora sp. NPDC059327 TaxID=3346803 RepID=UPI0036B998BD
MRRRHLLPLLPARLLRRFGHHTALHDPAALAAALEADLDAVNEGRPTDLARALERSTAPADFQPGLLGLHREAAGIVGYLCSAAAASETHLDLHDPDQRRLYQDLLDAVRAAEELRLRVAEAASHALPALAESTTALQHS